MATTDFLRWFKFIKEYLAQKRLVDTTATELDDTVLSSIPGRAVCADQLQLENTAVTDFMALFAH